MLDIDVDISGLKQLFTRFITTTQNLNQFTGDVLGWVGDRYVVIMKNIIDEIDYSGRLRESVGKQVAPDKMSVEIGPNVPNQTQDPQKVYTVWLGHTAAFYPPIQELKNWAQVKLGNRDLGYYLQKRIGGEFEPVKQGGVSRAGHRRETPGFSFPERTLASPEAQVILEEAGDRIGKKLIADITGGE